MRWLHSLLAFVFATGLIAAQEKVVLITGASSGIGFATAKAFHEKGWKVWAGYRNNKPSDLRELKNVRLCLLDVTDTNLIQAAVEKILQEDGRIDALINNAGYGLIGVEECVTIDEAEHLFDVNFFGALRLIQAVLPTMRHQKSGHIINISSGVGIYALPGLGVYSASKFAIEALSESLAATVSPWNIKVSIVEPGFVQTAWGSHCIIGSRNSSEEFYKQLNEGIRKMLTVPQGQPAEDVAALIVKISETAEPNVRYQTNERMTEWIRKKMNDVTGMNAYKSNLEFIEKCIK